jgi:hypothetical protein
VSANARTERERTHIMMIRNTENTFVVPDRVISKVKATVFPVESSDAVIVYA